MKPAAERRPFHQRAREVLQRPFLGPLSFGLVLGGVPLGIMFSLVHDLGYWLYCLLWCTPIALVVSFVGAVGTLKAGRGPLLLRAFLASVAACVPAPTLAGELLDWRRGLPAPAMIKDIRVQIYVLSVWAVAVALPGWLLALIYIFFRDRGAKYDHHVHL
jgi:hypothetical protein